MDESGEGIAEEIAEGLGAVARAIRLLANADASTPMGGLADLGQCFLEGCERLAIALNNIADAIKNKGG